MFNLLNKVILSLLLNEFFFTVNLFQLFAFFSFLIFLSRRYLVCNSSLLLLLAFYEHIFYDFQIFNFADVFSVFVLCSFCFSVYQLYFLLFLDVFLQIKKEEAGIGLIEVEMAGKEVEIGKKQQVRMMSLGAYGDNRCVRT